MDEFDCIPKEKEPPYKYYSPLPKKKNERKRLKAHACSECEKYYAEFPNERMQSSSRHRGNKRPPTPEHYWDLDFPDYEIKTDMYRLKSLSENKYFRPEKTESLSGRGKNDPPLKKKNRLDSKPLT
ncbi:hypothetical protein AVEN_57378-1 [Araneus ventricosus]|uniref:DNA endonuclease activator Ctp1 C-terminal domain-containing protein n=1 Tax=Araneus ventricosus TaxID=182803 RepID=A0A4Y2S9C6_ARAVE|nr:hypothetical protein AVEN_57378-1 [Araneus ventricosus]